MRHALSERERAAGMLEMVEGETVEEVVAASQEEDKRFFAWLLTSDTGQPVDGVGGGDGGSW